MGLDFSIELRIKSNDKIIKEKTMAYWRKCYSIRNNVINFCINSGYLIEADEDFEYECKIDLLPKLIEYLKQEYDDPKSDIFYNSVWGEEICREITYEQIKELEVYSKEIDSCINRLKSEKVVMYDEFLLDKNTQISIAIYNNY